MKNEPVIQVGVPRRQDDDEIDEIELDELLDELKEETEEDKPVRQAPLTTRVRRLFNRPKPTPMVYRFQKLAGIVDTKDVASITLRDGRRVYLKQLPPWYDVLRYKLAGLKYEEYV